MTLADAEIGKLLEVVSITDSQANLYALRFGLSQGAELTIAKRVAGGPVIVSRNHLEVAIGHQMALQIEVQPVEP